MKGVDRREISVSLAADALAVAYRSPNLSPEMATAIIQFAASKVGLPYSVTGAVLSTDKIMCRIFGSDTSFFCSQLVMAAYEYGGRPLSDAPAACVTLDDTVFIAKHKLTYVGHLKGNAAWLPKISP